MKAPGLSRRMASRMMLLMALLIALIPVASAQSQEVPQPWIVYAQLVGHQFQAWLEADDDAANQLHQYLEDRILNAKDDAPPPPAVVIRAWIGADGRVTRVEFDSLGDAQADAILHRLLSGHLISEPPPADMRQPLRVRLHLTANAEAGASVGCAVAHCVPAS